MMEYIFEQKPVPEGKGESYYDLVIEKYKQRRKSNPDANIVISLCVFNKAMRDYLRK